VDTSINLDTLLKLRLTVARFGEMDNARWWNTNGQLGNLGTAAVRRGFPRTHFFAQARAVFAVAEQRCREIFHPPQCVTLWRLSEAMEEEFETRWEHWLDDRSEWQAFFQRLEAPPGGDLLATFRALGLCRDRGVQELARLRRSAEGRAVQLPGTFSSSQDDVTLLALGFARGALGELAVPYQRLP
jgi:hypothetical protein